MGGDPDLGYAQLFDQFVQEHELDGDPATWSSVMIALWRNVFRRWDAANASSP